MATRSEMLDGLESIAIALAMFDRGAAVCEVDSDRGEWFSNDTLTQSVVKALSDQRALLRALLNDGDTTIGASK